LGPIASTPVVKRGHQAVTDGGRMLEVFDRPAWLYRPRASVPAVELEFRSPRPVSEEDVALCQRLVNAYAVAQAEAPTQSGMWGQELFQDRQRELLRALRGQDASALAERMASLFRSDFVLGMAGGSQGLAQTPIAKRVTRLSILGKFVSLAESQAAARVENPEQGEIGLAFVDGIEALMARTESAVGTALNFPDVGAAYGIGLAGRLITHETPDQVYGAIRLRDAMRTYLPERPAPLHVVEIGGGYGGMAYWLLQILDARYTIVDLPVVNVIQGYFLSQALGVDQVSLHGEPAKRVSITPTHALAGIPSGFDVLANKDSLPEIPESDAVNYLAWAREQCAGIFYSNNQEAAAVSDGVPQNVVPEMLERIGGYVRLRRDASWIRRGYVDEVYRIATATSSDETS
jgi:hypothetical protein